MYVSACVCVCVRVCACVCVCARLCGVQILVSAGFDAAAGDEAHVFEGRIGVDLEACDFEYMGRAVRGLRCRV